MGLAVRVYKNIKQTNNEEEYDFEAFVIDDNWKYKIKNLEEGKLYEGDCVDRTISYPYSAHNRFRETLLKLIGRDDLLTSEGKVDWANLPSDIPFYELIDFADNEGCLDWEVSEKLYKDFKDWETKADEFYSDFQIDKYKEWLNVFELGKDRGVVVFS